MAEWQDTLMEAQRIVDRVRFTDRDLGGYVPEQAWSDLGAVSDYIAQVRAMPLVAPPAPTPDPPTPKPPTTDSFGGTYDASHGYAFDLYPNGEDGPHYGVPLVCPVDGTVERYSIMVGASGKLEYRHEYGQDPGAVTNVLPALPDFLAHYADRQDLIAASPMFIAVMTPTSPVVINGQRLVRFWFGHVQDGFATGPRKAGDRLAYCGNSGIASLPGEASHVHCCASTTGTLSPNGDAPGELAARWLGFNPRVTYVPGPQQYATGQWFRGKKR
jgi:hypothetical protein